MSKPRMPEGFMDRFVDLLNKSGISVDEMLRACGYTNRKTAYRFKDGETTPPISLIVLVSKRTGKSLDYIFYGRE